MNQEPTASHLTFWRNPITIILGSVVLFIASQMIGMVIATPLAAYLQNENYKMTLFVAVNCIVFFLLLALLMRPLHFNWRQVGFRRVPVKAILLTIPAFFLYFVVSMTLTLLATKFIPGFDVDQAQDIGFSQSGGLQLFLTFVSLVLLTPLLEETLFRGLLFRGLRAHLPFWWSALLSSIIFGLAHMQLNVAIDTLALGLTLSYLTERYNSIVPAITLHALKNSLAFTLLFILQ